MKGLFPGAMVIKARDYNKDGKNTVYAEITPKNDGDYHQATATMLPPGVADSTDEVEKLNMRNVGMVASRGGAARFLERQASDPGATVISKGDYIT